MDVVDVLKLSVRVLCSLIVVFLTCAIWYWSYIGLSEAGIGVKALVTGTSVPMKPDAANGFLYPRPGIPVLIIFYGIPGLIGVVVGFIALCLGIRFIWGGNTTWRVSFSFLSKFRR